MLSGVVGSAKRSARSARIRHERICHHTQRSHWHDATRTLGPLQRAAPEMMTVWCLPVRSRLSRLALGCRCAGGGPPMPLRLLVKEEPPALRSRPMLVTDLRRSNSHLHAAA